MTRSLRQRFIWVLGVGSMLAWGLLALWQSYQVRQEVTALFDAHIAESAKLLEALVRSESLEYPSGKGLPPAFDRFIAAELKRHLSLPAYVQDHAYQISFGAPPRRLQSANAPAVALAPEGQTGFSQTVIKGAVWRVFTLRGQGSNGEIVASVGEPLAVRAQVVRRVSFGLGVPILSSLILLLWLLWWGISWGLRPLSELAREVASRTPADLQPLAEDVPAEVKPLTVALNHLLERLAATLQIEREFTADAAHELRNPLAGIKTQTQVAQRARFEAERSRALDQVMLGVDHTTRLVAQLLSLARVDPDFSQGEFAEVGLREVVAEVFIELAAMAASRQVILLNEVPAEHAIRANPDGLRSVLRNLLDNAIKHGASPGEVRVSAQIDASDRAPDLLEITLEDNGPGIPAASQAQMLRRFTRLPGTAASGSGLGLAIVARIVELHRATLGFDQRDRGGLRITLRWPAA